MKSEQVLVQQYIEKVDEISFDAFSVNCGKDCFVVMEANQIYNMPDKYSPYWSIKNSKNVEMQNKISEVIEEIGLEGIFEFEFMKDKDGNLWFLEINFRNTALGYATTVAGMPQVIYWCESMEKGFIDKKKYYKEIPDGLTAMAECFDYAISNCRFNADIFSKLFVQSGYADKFERGNPAIVSGISGIELAQEIIMYAYTNYKFPEKIFSEERSEVYWTGWALAEYQWDTCRRFKDIFSRIPLSEIVTMYSVYHEMDIGHFIEDMNKRYMSITQEIHLKTIRENRGISQVELAALSGVKLRSIQMYEQKVNDIDKAQARTLYKLSRVLGCSIEDLLENPEL